jgi:hypothetical protein
VVLGYILYLGWEDITGGGVRMIERDRSEAIRSVTAAELSIMAELYAEPAVRLKAADEDTSGSSSHSPDLSSSGSPIVSGSSSTGVSGEGSGDTDETSGSNAAEEEHASVDDSDTEDSDRSEA